MYNRIIDTWHRAGQAGLERQPAARSEHAIGFGKDTRLIGDVHQHALRPYHIEGRLLEWEVQRAPVLEGNPLLEADAGRQHDGGRTEFLGEVKSGNPAAILCGQRTCRSPKATSHIEHVHARAQSSEARQLPRGFPPAIVLFIKRR